MMISLVLYSKESVERVIEKTKMHFSDYSGAEMYDDSIWLDYMYIKIIDKMIVVNVFNKNSEWKCKISEYLHTVLKGEQVFVSNSNYSEKYFRTFTSSSNIEYLYS